MKWVLNVVGLLIILLLDACPNTAFPATPTPRITPIPLSVLPLSFDDYCIGKHQGHVTGRILTPQGLYVVCERGHGWLFTKVGIPPIEVTPVPGLNP
jgi:hypothetical protein